MGLLALAITTPEVVEKAIEPALSVFAQTTLGAVALVGIALAVLSVWKLSSVQDKRAADAKEAAEKYAKLNSQMFEFQSNINRTLEALVQAERNGEQTNRETAIALAQIQQSLNTTIRDALLKGRTPQPGPYGPPRPPGGRY